MKKFILAVCVCLIALTMVGSAYAEELWDWHLRGADEGLASGALPPPGLYFINDFYWTGDWYGHGVYVPGVGWDGSKTSGAKINGFVDVPILLWNPGICQILGATYAAAIAQPFDNAIVRAYASDGSGPAFTGSQWGAYNTILIPFILSWEIPCNFHVAASLAIGLNDGTTSPGDSLASLSPHLYGDRLLDKNFATTGNVYAWSSSDSYQFTPDIGISWLYAGWNLSAEFQYTFWTKDDDCDIQNGDELAMDFTATYTCGKWTFGLGAEGENQTYNDKGVLLNASGVPVYTTIPNSCAINWTAGPIVGYNFGPCDLLFTYNFEIMTKNDVGGDWAMLRLIIPLGNPCNWYK